MIVTRKIQIAVLADDQEEKTKAYDFLRELDRNIWRAANQMISDQWFYEEFENKVMKPDQEKIKDLEQQISQLYEQRRLASEKEQKKQDKKIEKLKKEKNKVLSQAKKDAKSRLKELFEVSRQQLSWRMIAQKYPQWGSYIFDALSQKVNQDFGNDYIDVLQGKKAVRKYRKGLPIPFRARGMQFVRNEEKGEYYINWLKGIRFILVFGRDKNSRKSEVDKIIDGEYGYGDSSIQIKGKKLFLLLSLKHPDKPNKVDPDKTINVDAGMLVPVKVTSEEGESEYFGQADDLLKFRIQLQRRYRKMQSDLKITTGGKGRKKKLKHLERFKLLERNFIRTYNHKLSKQIIQIALKERAGNIIINEVKFSKKDDPEDAKKFETRNWAGHELSQMVAYKAKMNHIGTYINKNVERSLS